MTKRCYLWVVGLAACLLLPLASSFARADEPESTELSPSELSPSESASSPSAVGGATPREMPRQAQPHATPQRMAAGEVPPEIGYSLFDTISCPGEAIELTPAGMSCGSCPEFMRGYSGSCGPGGCPEYCHFYARGEYLAWWMRGDRIPPLVTTSPSSTPRADAGVLGQPNTTVLFGNDSVNEGVHSGVRVVLGMCLSPVARIEGEWFVLGGQSATFSQTSDGSTILARPFYNLQSHSQDANIVSYPSQLAGTINATVSNQFVGAGVHASYVLSYEESCDRFTRIDFLYGFRYLGFYDQLSVNSSSTSLDPSAPFPTGTVFNVNDYFGASSNFYGANLGAMMERRSGRWYLTMRGWLGLGGTAEQVSINGRSSLKEPGSGTDHFNGGLLALPSNIGQYQHGSFTVAPQLELKLAYLLTPSLRVTLGYDLIYWSRVARAGDQVSLNVNPSQAGGQPLAGQAGPLYSLRETDLLLQGISTGIEWRY